MTYDVLIVGLGQIGMGYDYDLDPSEQVYTHSRAISLHPDFNLIAAIDPDPGKRLLFEKKYQRPAYSDIDIALKNHSPHVVIIASPTHLHGELFFRILGHIHPLTIVCEKPLSYDFEEAEAMVLACERRNIQLFVNYIRRSDPGVVQIKGRLDRGDIKGPIKGVVWYTKGFIHNGSHFFNLLEYWLGPERDSKIIESVPIQHLSDVDVDGWFTFAHGSVVFRTGWDEAFSFYSVELICRNGRLVYNSILEHIEWYPAQPDTQLQGYTVLTNNSEVIPTGKRRYQYHVVEQLAAALKGDNAAHICTGAQALQTLKSMKHILKGSDCV